MIGELWKRDIEFEDINLLPYFQKFVLQTAIFIGYGIELDCYKEHSQFCQEIIDIENKIIRLRSPISNLQDSILVADYASVVQQLGNCPNVW